MRVAIAAGGTGGHVYPAVAVAGDLMARGDEVLWFGRPASLEESEAKALGAQFAAIPLQGLKRRFTLENLTALVRFLKGRSIAKSALRGFRAEVLFALGSYVSAPVISAALGLGIPVALHEQNSVPGLVVGHYARKVSVVLLTTPLMSGNLMGKSRLVGMPLRPRIVLERKDEYFADLGISPDKKTLFIFGGSQGAKALCLVGLDLARVWEVERPDWQILLQTGVANLHWASGLAPAGNVLLVGHLHEMGKAYACADVIVSRSGAVSCAEIQSVAKPSVLVPYRYATRDHQKINAEALAREYPAVMVIQEENLNAAVLDDAVQALVNSKFPKPSDQREMNPVRRIVDSLEEIARGGKR